MIYCRKSLSFTLIILNQGGASVAFYSPGNNYNAFTLDEGRCLLYTAFDINGPSAPNRVGVDLFKACLEKTDKGYRLYNRKDDSNLCSINSNDEYHNGISCLNWILRHKNMEYLHKNVQDKW